ncbi:MAG: hypothetical protein R3D67_02525 [Hyphomicrobiaceae bacterium]
MAVMVAAGLYGATGSAQAKELSDKSVKILMDYAWTILPAKFTMPDRRVVEVDKKHKKKETMVPPEVGREIIQTGYFSAQAQLCEMWEEQTQNYDAMIRIQRAKHNWTDQQLLYITTLHRMTIHMAAGKLKVTEKNGERQVSLEPIEPSKDTCNDEKRAKVKAAVAANIKEALALAPPKKSAVQPTQGVVPASQKK